MANTPEGRIKDAVKKYLTALGAYWYMPVSNGMGRVGCPDFLICYKGRFIACETKAPGKRHNTTPNPSSSSTSTIDSPNSRSSSRSRILVNTLNRPCEGFTRLHRDDTAVNIGDLKLFSD